MNKAYILDGQIKYTTVDRCLRFYLSDARDNVPVILPVPAARLLQFLLERNSEVVAKDELLEAVWEDYGLKGSIHNLAHYTMILRKAFRDMGINKNIIVTIHKKGLSINPLIQVKTEDEGIVSLGAEDEYQDNSNDNKNVEVKNKSVESSKFKMSLSDEESKYSPPLIIKKNVILFLVLITCSGFLIYTYFVGNNGYSVSSVRLLNTIDSCKVYTFNSKSNDSMLMNDILIKTSKFHLNCKKNRVIIYSSDAFLGPNITGKKFHTSLILCTESTGLEDLNSCVSHYYN